VSEESDFGVEGRLFEDAAEISRVEVDLERREQPNDHKGHTEELNRKREGKSQE